MPVNLLKYLLLGHAMDCRQGIARWQKPALPKQALRSSVQPALHRSSARVCKCRSPAQHLKKSRQIETEMMYGSTPRTPIKRRVLGPHTPGKVRKVNSLCEAA